MNNKTFKCVNIIVFVVSIVTLLLFSLISPYQLWSLNETTPIIDDDKLLVLRIYWLFCSMVNSLFVFLNIKNKNKFFIAYIVLSLYGIYKILSLCFV